MENASYETQGFCIQLWTDYFDNGVEACASSFCQTFRAMASHVEMDVLGCFLTRLTHPCPVRSQ